MAEVTLQTIAGGAAPELFLKALGEVLANVGDPNTEPDAPREIALVVKIVPSKDRSIAAVGIQAKTKLAPPKAHAGAFFLSRDESGEVKASQSDVVQRSLFGDADPANVRPMAQERSAT